MSAAPDRLGDLVPMAFVADVKRSAEFYQKLGFRVMHTYEPEGKLCWVHLQNGGADLMLSLASDPVEPKAQAVLFYLYAPNVAEYREKLLKLGVEAGELQYFFHAKHGEFRVSDPDGYVLLVGQMGQ